MDLLMVFTPALLPFVVLDRDAWTALARHSGWRAGEDGSDDALLARSDVREALLARIRAATSGFPHYAQPRAVWPTLTPWTPDNSLLTPTLKLKRNNLAAYFQNEMERIYRR